MKRRTLELPIHLPKGGRKCLAIVEALGAQIRQGVLGPGVALPGSRALANTLGVHRNTVVAAYAELEREGWITTRPRSGTCVTVDLPIALRPRTTRPAPPTSKLSASKLVRWDLAGGLADVRLTPTRELAAAIRRVYARPEQALLEGDPRGTKPIRAAISQYLAEVRGWSASPAEVMMTRGSQMALWLLASALSAKTRSTARIAVESPGYRPAWDAFARAGLDVVHIPVDGEGLDVDALARAHKQKRLSAVYVTPHHQYPTTVTMSAARRLQLVALARQHGWQVIEDDYDHEFHYEGRPVPPLATLAPECVHYVGTFSKLLGPGFRLGFTVSRLVGGRRLVDLRSCVDRQGDPWVENAVASVIEDGTLLRHARRSRRIYHARRDSMIARLTDTFGETLRFDVPDGGLSIWAHAARGIDVARWHERALERGVRFYPGQQFYSGHRARRSLRLGFANLTDSEQAGAVQALRGSLG